MSRKDQLEVIQRNLTDIIRGLPTERPAETPPAVAGPLAGLLMSLTGIWRAHHPKSAYPAFKAQLETLQAITKQFLNHYNSSRLPLNDDRAAVNKISDQLKGLGEDFITQVNLRLGSGSTSLFQALQAYELLRTICADMSPSSSHDADAGDRLIP
ncbi:MAG: hypothetical protein P1U34_07645 [Coxiellaceae bacterium]|nr:hypothetical protein [Coxiellaceae bacterium]